MSANPRKARIEKGGRILTTLERLGRETFTLASGRRHRIVVQVPLKATIPIRISHETLEQTRAWLVVNPVQVEVDGDPVPCGTVTTAAGRFDVQFRIPPGEHEVLISSVERRVGAARSTVPPRRIIYLSQTVTVREAG